MRLTLVVPELAAIAGEALARVPALARLAAYGSAGTSALDLDGALVEAAGASAATPIAPLAALGAGLDPGSHYVLRADPIALVAGRDDVLLAGRIDDLTPADAHAMIDALNRHFASDGLVFHAPRPDAWFVVARESVPVETSPLAAVRGTIHPHLPRGEHGKTWRRWLSEMQMLLHAQPANAEREAAGRAPVTGIWVSGGGVATRAPDLARVRFHAPPGRSGDVARGLAAFSNSVAVPTPQSCDIGDADAVFVLAAVTGEDALAALARDWLDPVVAALERGDLAHVTLLADGGEATRRWSAGAPSWWRRLRARL